MSGKPYAVVKAETKTAGTVTFKGSRKKCRQIMKAAGGVKNNHFVALAPSLSVGDKFGN